jgi:hypothetical protein
VGFVVPPGNHSEGINFSRPDLWEMNYTGPLPSSMAWSSAEPKPKPESDGLGFTWEPRHDRSRAGGLGATAVNTLWFNRQPAAFAAGRLLHHHHNGQLILQPTYFHAVDTKLTVARRAEVTEDRSSTVWLDTYSNFRDEPQEATVSYVSTFRAPVVAVWDARGNKHEVGDAADSLASWGGACAFVLEGEQQPATLLAFHKEGATIAPSLRWMSPTAVALDYSLKLGSNERAALLHGACQRPLTAFGGAQAAFADWLPMKPPPPSPAPANAPAQTSTRAPAPILNYAASN